MKQVDSKYYDSKYFQYQSNSPNFSKKLKLVNFLKKFKEISSLVSLKSTDLICDYGCGTGDLSFVLSLKYNCQIIGIDYSKTAITICNKKNILFQKITQPNSKIKFLNKNNNEIPKLKNVKAIFFCDVFEHLYDHEIKLILEQVSSWHKNPIIVIHTDNNHFLNKIEPLINFIKIISQKTTFEKIKNEKKEEQKRHVNLTNSKELTKKMAKYGYKLIKLQYPKLDKKTIKIQLGNLSVIKPIINLSFLALKIFPSLNPSFYAVYQKITF